MAEAALATPPAAPPATPPAAAPPWHQGIEADVIGSWQNKGWDITDPAKLVVEVSKSWKAAERHVGAPVDKIVRLPEPNDQAGWAGVWEKLGAPKEAKDYDIPAKYADGSDLDAGLADTLRSTFAKSHLPKEAAGEVAKAIVKYVEEADKSEATLGEQRKADQIAALQRDWGAKQQENQVIAINGARRLGLSSDQVKAMENALGYDVAAKLLHKIGVGTTESSFVEGGTTSANTTTSEQATSRLNDYAKDKEWSARLQAGHPPTVREWKALMEQKHGISEAQELANM